MKILRCDCKIYLVLINLLNIQSCYVLVFGGIFVALINVLIFAAASDTIGEIYRAYNTRIFCNCFHKCSKYLGIHVYFDRRVCFKTKNANFFFLLSAQFYINISEQSLYQTNCKYYLRIPDKKLFIQTYISNKI